MENKLKRKEVWLYPVVLKRLQVLADKRKWSLKQYMEHILEKDSRKVISGMPSVSENKSPKK